MNINSSTKLICLLGQPVNQSFSPSIHNYLSEKYNKNNVYMCFEIEKNNLKHLIEHVETFDQDYIDTLGKAAKERIKNDYSWAKIVAEYENLFLRKKDL